jgi:hypothetical protein
MVLRRADGVVYMRRRRIVQTPWFGLYLHRFDAADPGLDLHDHPWWFASIVLRGGYVEEVAAARDAPRQALFAEEFTSCNRGVERAWHAPSVHSVRLDECHSIRRLLRVPTWTLVVCGPRRRTWGFYEPDGWVRSQSYATERRALYVEGQVSS